MGTSILNSTVEQTRCTNAFEAISPLPGSFGGGAIFVNVTQVGLEPLFTVWHPVSLVEVRLIPCVCLWPPGEVQCLCKILVC